MNKKNPFIYYSLVICIILVSFTNAYDISNYSNPNIRFSSSSAENHTQIRSFGFGMGVSSIDFIFPTFNYEINFSRNRSRLMTLRFIYLNEFGFKSADLGSIKEIGLLVGTYENNKHIFASLSGGLGLVSGNITRRGANGKPRKWGKPTGIIFSIPLEIKLIIKPVQTIGFGIKGFANVNTYTFFNGIIISIYLFDK